MAPSAARRGANRGPRGRVVQEGLAVMVSGRRVGRIFETDDQRTMRISFLAFS
jgi:hypothetical protein